LNKNKRFLHKQQVRKNPMKKIPLVSCTGFLVLALLCLLCGARTAQARAQGASQNTTKAWHIVPSPNVQATYNALNGVVALSKTNVWAVGQESTYPQPNQTLTEHWNGSQWSIVPTPVVGLGSQFNAAAQIPNTNHLWAVGTQYSSSNGPQTLIERWNGTKWNVIPTPILNEDPEVTSNIFYAVTALSRTDAWAVGVYYASGSLPQVALIEHWNGKAWSLVPGATPAGTSFSWLYGIVALSANNIWAVGTYSAQVGGGERALIEHWNGTAWSFISAPNPGSIANFLYSVTRIPGTNHLWAVGNYLNGGAYQTLVEYWNGTTWSLVSSPSPGMNDNFFSGVAAVSATDVWAVGAYTSGNGDLNLTEHWNGTNWSVVASPNPSNTDFLSAVTRVPASGGNLWAVGNYYNSNNNELTLTELYS